MCDKGCKSRATCAKEDKGLFVEVRYLQLHDIDIPLQVNERKLLSLIRDLEKEKEQSIKQEMIVKKETEKLVILIYKHHIYFISVFKFVKHLGSPNKK